ncbi:MAG: 1-acyl-sn-glycerol-3-phosphate acyltransferase [Chloroflexota bacterium]|nr:1-acyl-sn-glycerol-3-phosphate acyltransferase [Chloroflexota bacterium]
MSQSSYPVPEPPGRLRYAFIRYGLRFFVSCYLRVRVEGAQRLPADNYLLNFSHPNWVDPLVLVAFWPDRRYVFIFGPKEHDMAVGARNRLIRWGQLGVPFKPTKRDLLDTTRRATSVLRGGHILAVAGEGRLSDDEGRLAPLEEGAAYLALRAGVPIVPLAIIGTRWLRFGKRVRLRIGEPVETAGRRADREDVARVTAELTSAMAQLVEGVRPEPPPGPFGRWLTDVFNERPWLEKQDKARQS